MKMIKQRGFLVYIAIFLIVIVGFLGVAITSMFTTSITEANNYQQAAKALYIAEAGFEKSARFIYTPTLTGANARIACSGISSNANLTNASFGSGAFTATAVSGSPYYTNTTLSNAIGNSNTTIPVNSTSGFATSGRIMIDSEIISYGAISGNNFIGVVRGVNMNYSTAHASGAPVSQYQCNIDLKGGIPNLTSALYQQEIQQAVQLQEGWAVGSASGTNFELTRFNRPTELSWNSSALANNSAAALNSISMLSNAEGWAVGNAVSTQFTILHWLGSNWSLTSAAASCSSENLLGVTAVSSQEAWAVGTTYGTPACAAAKQRYNIIHWNGNNWSILTPSTSPSIPADNKNNQNLNAVHVIGAAGNSTGNVGFAVGDTGTILQYNGSNWIQVTSPTTKNLTDIYVVSATEAWAVGAAGTILKWNGASWSTVTSPTTVNLNSIYMNDLTLSGTATNGWAVGDNGVAISYDGLSWTLQSTSTTQNLFGVASFFTANDVWAVGAAGTMMHYDGNSWSSVTSGVSVQLNAISLIRPQQYPFAWQQI